MISSLLAAVLARFLASLAYLGLRKAEEALSEAEAGQDGAALTAAKTDEERKAAVSEAASHSFPPNLK